MITLHHLNHSRSQRIIWLLEELQLPYEIKLYERDPQTMLAPQSLLDIHPLGKSPVITDGELTIAESGAIIEYLVDTYDTANALKPAAGTQERLDYVYWLHYAEGSLMPLLVMKLVFGRLSHPPMPLLLRPVATLISKGVQRQYLDKQIKRHLDYLEKSLVGKTWFTGESLSAADIQMCFPLETIALRGGLHDYPRLENFVKASQERPAYVKAREKGGSFEFLR